MHDSHTITPMEFRSPIVGTPVHSNDKQQLVSSSSGKQQLVPVKKKPLSDLPNGTRNAITNPCEAFLPKEKGDFSDFVRTSGVKRHSCDCSSDTLQQSTCDDAHGHFVYARRKVEGAGKLSACDDMDMTMFQKRKDSNDQFNTLGHQPHQIQEIILPTSAAFSPSAKASAALPSCGASPPILKMPTSQLLSAAPSMISCRSPVRAISPSSNRMHWKERFLKLQMFLNSCDQSSQEDYVQMLRSLSAIGRSKHAVELEKRAIHLLLEEGKELHRMKLLNVLGKASPSHV